ncbi:MAG: TIM barrel protein [Ruminococcus sp.]|nr:TIM barrel protein [Candidatus Apopatosoma intestinale]
MNESFPLGLTSVTFRKKNIREVAELAARGGLSLIEWGADIHVQSGDREAAKEAVRQMAENGLSCPSYGTYYRNGDRDPNSFLRLCENAGILGAKTLRLWLGRKAGADCTETDFSALVEETEPLADLAGRYGLTVAFEYHGKTYNDEAAIIFASFPPSRATMLKRTGSRWRSATARPICGRHFPVFPPCTSFIGIPQTIGFRSPTVYSAGTAISTSCARRTSFPRSSWNLSAMTTRISSLPTRKHFTTGFNRKTRLKSAVSFSLSFPQSEQK